MAKDKLLIPIRKNLFDDYIQSRLGAEEDSSKYFENFSDEQLRDINLILRRIKLSDNVHSDDVFTKINKGIGMFEDGALRMHLYLTCIESLARMLTSNKFLPFGNWINAKKEPYKSEKASVSLSENMSNEEIVKSYNDKYNSLHGTKSMFYYFFVNGLSEEQRIEFTQNMFVLESNPLPKVYHINPLEFSKVKTGNDDLDIIVDKRIIWDKLKMEIKLELIAKAFYKVRNHFTHSLIPYTSVQDKKGNIPIPTNGIVDRGDTVFVWEEGIAIGSLLNPLNHYLREMTLEGLKNYILKKKEDNKV